jgi:hypothetical protein
MRTWALALLVACGGSDDPCDGVVATCVTVRITSESVAAIDTLQLDISYAGFHDTATTTAGRTALPLATALELDGATAAVIVDIVAAGKLAGAVLGTGYQRTPELAPGDHLLLELPIALRPVPCLAGFYCGDTKVDGDPETLYLCHQGGAGDPDGTPEADVPTARGVCVNGCNHNDGANDVCFGGNTPCTVGNTYCGGHKLDGDPLTLYRCPTSGDPVKVSDCAAAGKICANSGTDTDSCR